MAFNNIHEYKSTSFSGYRREELQFSKFKNYELTYGNFAREPSWQIFLYDGSYYRNSWGDPGGNKWFN